MNDLQEERRSRRLMAAIYPTRLEKFLGWAAMFCWDISNEGGGPVDRLGDWFDDLHSLHREWRAIRGTHDKAAPQ